MVVQGNEALGWGAVMAGCRHFFGYPVTPQNEVTEWFARELPKWGGRFVQSESEASSIAMLFGAAAAGVRAITSTAGPGWGLMQEGMSHLANAELPCVVVDVQRGGPGQGTTRHAQQDYKSVTRGGGQGDYRNIVLAPASIQENYELIQLAFHLADTYRIAVVLLSDGIVGQMAEPLELKELDFGPVPEKDWALAGSGQKGGRSGFIGCMQGLTPPDTFLGFLGRLKKKYDDIERSEVRYEEVEMRDAELAVVAYGYTARSALEAVQLVRQAGLKVGLVRPLTVWPFPYKPLEEAANRGVKLLVVEDSLGQMLEDVRLAASGKVEVGLVGILDRHDPSDGGMILPDAIFDKIVKMLEREVPSPW